MTYCSRCRQVTQDIERTANWSKIFIMVNIHCSKCGMFKHRYLMDKEKLDDKTE